MQSPDYKINQNSIEVGSSDETDNNYSLETLFGKAGANTFRDKGYIVQEQYSDTDKESYLGFTISKTNIMLNELKANKPIEGETAFTIQGEPGGYQVDAYEERPLQSKNGDSIENTKCDTGKQPCFEDQARPWDMPTSYGFGYTIKGMYSPMDFLNGRYFRPFSDISQADKPAVLIAASSSVKNSQATITFKVTPSLNQANDNYETIVNFVALPSY